MTETEQLEYNDALVHFASIVKQYGIQRVLLDFQAHYPPYFMELKHTIARLPDKPMAALLRK